MPFALTIARPFPCHAVPKEKGRSPPLPRRSPKQYLLISVTWCLPFRPTPGERVRLSLSSRTIPHDCSRGKWKASILGSPIDSNLALDCRGHSTGGARYPIIPGGQGNWNLGQTRTHSKAARRSNGNARSPRRPAKWAGGTRTKNGGQPRGVAPAQRHGQRQCPLTLPSLTAGRGRTTALGNHMGLPLR